MKNDEGTFFTARGYELSADKNSLTPSMEDYIEMIFRLMEQGAHVRVSDLAEKLNVQPPSVSKMMQKLKEKYLLSYEKYGYIKLTDEGEKLGEFLLERHNTLTTFFSLMDINADNHREVEQIEHHIGWNSYLVISALADFFKNDDKLLMKFLSHKNQYLNLRNKGKNKPKGY